ncbi:hypothetical protein TBLA_0B03850 [Henningerozyma blattae CBS 6284]|uniref:Folylpolyglutamate synthase n=1 Tax=Henningerozyma blattae (strain ATCC 34711 / CBS 6284 / DSM 70876 / NBRC 10599 / NRRL Y-10934 / UCD 77-7) TaxID=1071380 RepID=I2GYM2_HENB6|nr:hypothetical protein TBLA_0B03850 [Tetrapisispora blattae CBS 6284]CCH59224.1 hypothetical protein TBLA_0B03850 [Tetrapisispora blattae CBS 6284]
MRISLKLAMQPRTYQDALAALNSLQTNYAAIKAVKDSGNKNNQMALLDMKEWPRRIGYSVSDFNRLNVVHITGTKGKGSTAAFTSSILGQYKDQLPKVGLYTSPHLKSVRERIRINGSPISEELFTKYFFQVWNRLDDSTSTLNEFPHMLPGTKPAYFKFLTLLSFHVFMQENCNCCIYEVGVGGELDSTNIIEKPVACGISLIGIDHTFILGNTIEEISWNKGGILKPSVPGFTVENQSPESIKVLKERAAEKNTTIDQIPNFNIIKKIKLGIAGDFQLSNASLATALASQALNSLKIIDNPIDYKDSNAELPNKFLIGLENTNWPGRCQTLLEGNKKWYIDGAHTKDSMVAASTWFKKTILNEPILKDSKKILLFNQQSRDANALIDHLIETITPDIHFDDVIFTTNVTWKSGNYSADLVSLNTSKESVDKLEVQKSLAKHWKNLSPSTNTNSTNIHVTHSIQDAYEIIEKLSSKPVSIFVTGSLHLAGGLLVVLEDSPNNTQE